ncbi:MAG: tetratricopeptide repeat protein [Microcystis sp. M034S1]|uniref:tetratricopeptide repeat protein n=4 Tax=Microcystis TaxID=1125 RepID=UPI0025900EF9|nr:tetratricopeptide repeat protein [Microcystis sp. M034S1]MCA2910765.1 tetratricopeptide repeat protein [Microcystis sp. M034S1]
MKKRWQKFIILILAAFLIAITYLPSYSATQDALCSKKGQDDVCLDEQFLFHLKPEKLIPLPLSSHEHGIDDKKRRDIVEQRIKNIADDFSIEVDSIQVKPWNQKTLVIVSDDDVILTLTDADAERAESNKENLAKLYLEKIKKSVREYRKKNFYQTQAISKCSEIPPKKIPQSSGKVCLEDQFLFIVYNRDRASNISKNIQEIASNYSILTNPIIVTDFNGENPNIVSNGQIILTITNEDAKLAGVEAKNKKKLAEVYLYRIKSAIQEYRNRNFSNLGFWSFWAVIIVVKLILFLIFLKPFLIFLKAVKSKNLIENWKLKSDNLIFLLILLIFLILLKQLSVKFLEVTFLDIAGEGAVVVLLKIIGFLLLVVLLYSLFNWLSGKGAGGVAVVPFEDRTTSKSNGENSNKGDELGKAITDLFVADLDQINQLCLSAKPQKNTSSGVSSPLRIDAQENWSASDMDFFTIKSFGLGFIQLDLSVGKLLIFLKKIWPFGGVETVINGSIQHWNTKKSLIVQLKSPLKFKLVQVNFDYNDSDLMLNKVKELAYHIAYEIAPNQFLAQTWQEFVYKLGNIYFELGKYEKALSLYEESSQYEPNLWQPYHNAGVIYLYSDQQDLIDYDKAIDKFQKALEKFPESSISKSGLGLAYFFKATLSNYHDEFWLFWFLCENEVYTDSFSCKIALSFSCKIALKVLTDKQFHDYISKNYHTKSRRDEFLREAEESINEAIEFDSTNASYYWNLGLIRFSQGNLTGAHQAWNDARIRIPNDNTTKNKLSIHIYDCVINTSSGEQIDSPDRLLKSRDVSEQKSFLKLIVKDLRMLKKITNKEDFDSLIRTLQEAIEKPMVQRNLFQQAWAWLSEKFQQAWAWLSEKFQQAWAWLSEKFQQAWAWLSEKFQSFPPLYTILLTLESLTILILLIIIIYCFSK